MSLIGFAIGNGNKRDTASKTLLTIFSSVARHYSSVYVGSLYVEGEYKGQQIKYSMPLHGAAFSKSPDGSVTSCISSGTQDWGGVNVVALVEWHQSASGVSMNITIMDVDTGETVFNLSDLNPDGALGPLSGGQIVVTVKDIAPA
jgi:hypothetical protein